MKSFHQSMKEYKKQLEKGAIQEAYKGLMEYMMGLRTHFAKKYPDHFVSGSIYYGYDLFFLYSQITKRYQIKTCHCF